MFDKIIKIIDDTCRMPEVIEMCGHAMYIGKKSRFFIDRASKMRLKMMNDKLIGNKEVETLKIC